MVLNPLKKAIHCSKHQGPVFGTGPDLSISDKCNMNADSVANFPFSFNSAKKKYKFTQQDWTRFCGNPQGR